MTDLSPLITILVAVIAAALTYIFSRRAETLRALREARTKWAVVAMRALAEYEDAVADWVFSTQGPEPAPQPDLPGDPELQVLDPVGYRIALSMLHVHGRSVKRIAPRWHYWQEQGSLSSLLPPQVYDSGSEIEFIVARWCRASVTMPIWRMNVLYWRFLAREDAWAGFPHGEINQRMMKRGNRAAARRFREMMRAGPDTTPPWLS